jgi:Putative peptidoglycan binding domain
VAHLVTVSWPEHRLRCCLQVVKPVSAQIAFVLTALLAVAPFATANTTTTTHKHHATSTKSASTSKTHHHSSQSKAVHTSTHSTHHHGKTRHTAKKSWKSQGQHGISAERATQIQQALIQKHYLDGEATGVWDSKTQEACRKFQADNGWQTKVLPDSRALIKLGLGPDHKDVLNPETAATSPYLPGGGSAKPSDVIAPATASVPDR